MLFVDSIHQATDILEEVRATLEKHNIIPKGYEFGLVSGDNNGKGAGTVQGLNFANLQSFGWERA